MTEELIRDISQRITERLKKSKLVYEPEPSHEFISDIAYYLCPNCKKYETCDLVVLEDFCKTVYREAKRMWKVALLLQKADFDRVVRDNELFYVWRFKRKLGKNQKVLLEIFLLLKHPFRKVEVKDREASLSVIAIDKINERNIDAFFEPDLYYADGKGAIVFDTPVGFFVFNAIVEPSVEFGKLVLYFRRISEKPRLKILEYWVNFELEDWDFVPDEFRLLRDNVERQAKAIHRKMEKLSDEVEKALIPQITLLLSEALEKELVKDPRFMKLPEKERLKLLAKVRADRQFLEKIAKASVKPILTDFCIIVPKLSKKK